LGSDGNTYVNVDGQAQYNGEPVTIKIQYKVFASGRLDLQAFERNGKPQSTQSFMEFLSNVYAKYRMDTNTAINMVKNGRFDMYPQRAIGEAFERFISDISWDAINGTDGYTYVNITGACK